jgi:hypothetical protein
MTPLSRRSEKPDRSIYYRTTAPSVTHHTTKAQEGRDAFLEYRAPRWEDCPYYY